MSSATSVIHLAPCTKKKLSKIVLHYTICDIFNFFYSAFNLISCKRQYVLLSLVSYLKQKQCYYSYNGTAFCRVLYRYSRTQLSPVRLYFYHAPNLYQISSGDLTHV